MHTHSLSSRILDQIAISMAVICAIHCLVTPILLVGLPILATTVWVDANFHLWMILLVIPTTSLAVWSGCRRHRDRWVLGLAAVGVGLLSIALASERMAQAALPSDSTPSAGISTGPDAQPAKQLGASACASCSTCLPNSQNDQTASNTQTTRAGIPWHLALNLAGGLFLASGHARNFLLCRKDSCQHSNKPNHCR